MKDGFDENSDRKAWMATLAKAPAGRVGKLLNEVMTRPTFNWLRAPEIGSVMVQGRAGGTGSPFNVGEMTITRCAIALETGEIGHAYIQGRRKSDAEACALVDALMQTQAASLLRRTLLDVLETEATAAKRLRASKAAATKVDFFTMVRGDD